jgi:hypothetical protein
MPKQQFNLNLSKSLINAMSTKAKADGISLEDLALSAISEYVGYTPLAPKAALDKRLVVMETRIAKLEASLGESVA